MKKIFKIIGVVVLASTFLGAKKGLDLLSVAKQLKYSLQGIPKINISNKSIKINLKIKNPTKVFFNPSFFSVSNITLGLPNQPPIAITTKPINNITIEPNGYKIIKDIEFIVNLSLPQTIILATKLNQLELNFKVKFKNKEVKNITLKVSDFI